MASIDATFHRFRATFLGDSDAEVKRSFEDGAYIERFYPQGDGEQQILGWVELRTLRREESTVLQARLFTPVEEHIPPHESALSRLQAAVIERLQGNALSSREERVGRLALAALDKGMDSDLVFNACERRRWRHGQRVLTVGEPGEDFFVVVEGVARVRIAGRRSALIEEGDIFGEMAILCDGVRQATVDAALDLTVLAIPNAAVTPKARTSLWSLSAERSFESWVAAAPAFDHLSLLHRQLWLAKSTYAVLEPGLEMDLPGDWVFLYEGTVETEGCLFTAPMLLRAGSMLPTTDARVALLGPSPEPTMTRSMAESMGESLEDSLD